MVGRRSRSLAGPTLLFADPQVFSAHCFKAARSLHLKEVAGTIVRIESLRHGVAEIHSASATCIRPLN